MTDYIFQKSTRCNNLYSNAVQLLLDSSTETLRPVITGDGDSRTLFALQTEDDLTIDIHLFRVLSVLATRPNP